MDGDVAPERGLSSSMVRYSHEGEGERGTRTSIPTGGPSIRMSNLRGRFGGGGPGAFGTVQANGGYPVQPRGGAPWRARYISTRACGASSIWYEG